MNNSIKYKHIKRAIKNYGIKTTDEFIWFIDESRIFFGKPDSNGEIASYISGFISGLVFVVDYITDPEILDINGWRLFISKHLDMDIIYPI